MTDIGDPPAENFYRDYERGLDTYEEKPMTDKSLTEAVRKASEEAAKSFDKNVGFVNPLVDDRTFVDITLRHLAPVLEAALVRMREECAKICDERAAKWLINKPKSLEISHAAESETCAKAIRALPIPTPSLDALRDEVIEECARICETGYCSTQVHCHKKDAERIRALKGAKR